MEMEKSSLLLTKCSVVMTAASFWKSLKMDGQNVKKSNSSYIAVNLLKTAEVLLLFVSLYLDMFADSHQTRSAINCCISATESTWENICLSVWIQTCM